VSGASTAWRRRSGWLAAAGLFLAANAVFFFWYRGTGRLRQEGLESRRVALAAQVSEAESEAERLQGQSARLSRVSAALEEFYGKRIGTQRSTLAATVDEIHAILKRAGIAPSQIGYQTTALPKLDLSEMIASFSFAADYQKFKRLLDLFETGPRWIVVKEISLARDDDVPGSVQVRMTIATYFAGEGSQRDGRADSAGGVASAAPRSRS
jgi:hypothetical protein